MLEKFEVDGIYETCASLAELGVPLLHALHDDYKAFVSAPDSVVIELFSKRHCSSSKGTMDIDEKGGRASR